MDFFQILEWFTYENLMELIQNYRSFGPIPGIILPIVEAFLPFAFSCYYCCQCQCVRSWIRVFIFLGWCMYRGAACILHCKKIRASGFPF